MAVVQLQMHLLTLPHRGQAPSHIGSVQVFGYAVAISITEIGVASPRSRVPIRQKP